MGLGTNAGLQRGWVTNERRAGRGAERGNAGMVGRGSESGVCVPVGCRAWQRRCGRGQVRATGQKDQKGHLGGTQACAGQSGARAGQDCTFFIFLTSCSAVLLWAE